MADTLLLVAALSSPWSKIRNKCADLFKLDTRALFIAIITAFMSAILITWSHIFINFLAVVSAGILVKLDAQTARLNQRQSFWLLAIVSLFGIGIGAVAQTLIE